MQPTLSEQTQFYNQYWSKLKSFGSYKVARIVKILQYLAIVCKSRKNPQILDLGCGDGRCVAIWNEFGKATGLDLSDEAMKAAKSRYPFLEFFQGDATATTFPSETFDVIISQEVIEHIEDQPAYIDECHRLLRANGCLILTTPNKYYFDRTEKGNYSRQPIEKILLPGELKQLLVGKFEIIKMESIVFAGANKGVYRIVTNSLVVAAFKTLGLEFLRHEFMSRFNLGVHLCVMAIKK